MQNFTKNIINLYGDAGRQWLDDLPQLIKHAETTYGLSNLKPVNNLSYNYVVSGFQGIRPIILKLGLDRDGLKREAAALMSFKNFGVVNVFAESDGLLLLECAEPGTSLKALFPEDDDTAIEVAADVIKRLHKAPVPAAPEFPHIKNWLAALDHDAEVPLHYLRKARNLCDHLLVTAEQDVLLHGDVHHDNILQSGKDWMVIDPKGVIGEPIYEVAAFIRNPMPALLMHDNVQRIALNRITRFARAFNVSEKRILDWCFVQAVLAWVWGLEDGGDVAYFKTLTEFFDRYL